MIQRVCVVGAGPCGVTAAKALKQANIPFDCYEATDRVGGNWVFGSSRSSAYRWLFVNTSKRTMQYSDFPMPESYPTYPHHTQVAKYLDDYVDRFGVRPHIQFGAEVASIKPNGKGWDVRVGGVEEPRKYDAVIVANGHHSKEKWPSFRGTFDGQQVHSHTYREASPFAGKRVLVVGAGASAVDIACEVSRVAGAAWLSTRRGVHIIPKFIGGKPPEEAVLPLPLLAVLPRSVAVRYLEWKLEKHRGKMTDWGFPEPDHRLLDSHATVNEEVLPLVRQGRLKIKGDIRELRGARVAFVDGSEEQVDVIINATGYEINFPFFDREVMNPVDNEVRLYRNVVHPRHEGLYFVGLVQVQGAVMPIAELQSVWVAKLLAGEVRPPRREVMERAIDEDVEATRRRFVRSSRHTIEVDPLPYVRMIQRELRTTATLRDVVSSKVSDWLQPSR